MKKPKFITEFDDIPAPRATMPELPLDECIDEFIRCLKRDERLVVDIHCKLHVAVEGPFA